MWNVLSILLIAVPAVLCGTCLNSPPKKDVNLRNLEGMWYGHYTLTSRSKDMEENRCQRMFVYVKDDNKHVELVESVLEKYSKSSQGQSIYTGGKQEGTDGRLSLKGTIKGTSYNFNYTVLATDYTSYLVASMCIDDVNVGSAWILTRRPESITNEVMSNLLEELARLNLPLSKFTLDSPQTRCAPQ